MAASMPEAVAGIREGWRITDTCSYQMWSNAPYRIEQRVSAVLDWALCSLPYGATERNGSGQWHYSRDSNRNRADAAAAASFCTAG